MKAFKIAVVQEQSSEVLSKKIILGLNHEQKFQKDKGEALLAPRFRNIWGTISNLKKGVRPRRLVLMRYNTRGIITYASNVGTNILLVINVNLAH